MSVSLPAQFRRRAVELARRGSTVGWSQVGLAGAPFVIALTHVPTGNARFAVAGMIGSPNSTDAASPSREDRRARRHGQHEHPVKCLNPALALASVAGQLLRAALVCLPLKGIEVALRHVRLLGAQRPLP